MARKDYMREYYLANREKVREQYRARSEQRKEYERKKSREAYARNPEAGKAKALAWGRANPELRYAYQRRWRQENPGQVVALKRNRDAAFMQRTPSWLTDQDRRAIREIYELAAELSWLSEGGLQVDHIVPLRGRSVSGLHVPWNLQILPSSENLKKGNRYG